MQRFFTLINCMDGRVQEPVHDYLVQRYAVDYIDVISEPGPNRILAERTDEAVVASILERVKISVEAHHSEGIALAGHHDCAGNPTSNACQHEQTLEAVRWIKEQFPALPVIGLWVNDEWQVSEVQAESGVA